MNLSEIQQGFNNQTLFDGVNREIVRGDKIALIGANGTGKSTFLNIIANEINFKGHRKEGHQVISSFYAQHQLESLHLDYEILEELQYDAPHKTEMDLRNMLGCFLFGGDDVFKKIKVLSGGEKARVSLAKTLVSEANFLLLDEPTNHLDIDSIEIIIEALKRYEGTLIFVSHNRYFIEKLANKVWWIEDKDVKEYPGDYTEYLYKIHQSQKSIESTINKKKTQKLNKKNSKDSWKQKDKKDDKLKKLQKKLDKKEEQLENAQVHLKALEEQLNTIEGTNQSEYVKLSKEYSNATTLVNHLTQEAEKMIEEIINLE